jgi:hypothetical protein
MRRGCRSALSIRTARCHDCIHSCEVTIDISQLGKLARRKGLRERTNALFAGGSWLLAMGSCLGGDSYRGCYRRPLLLFCADPIDKT